MLVHQLNVEELRIAKAHAATQQVIRREMAGAAVPTARADDRPGIPAATVPRHQEEAAAKSMAEVLANLPKNSVEKFLQREQREREASLETIRAEMNPRF
jgi:hypothetical protein